MHGSISAQPGSGQLHGMHCLHGLAPQTQLATHTLCSTRPCEAPCSQSRRQHRLQAWAREPSPEREVGCLALVPGAAGQAAASAAAAVAATSGEGPAGKHPELCNQYRSFPLRVCFSRV